MVIEKRRKEKRARQEPGGAGIKASATMGRVVCCTIDDLSRRTHVRRKGNGEAVR